MLGALAASAVNDATQVVFCGFAKVNEKTKGLLVEILN